MLNADIMDTPVTILQALDNQEIFVSIRQNRLYGIPSSDKKNFKLVFAITTLNRQGGALINRIKSSVPTSEFLYEEHRDGDVAHLIVYCKSAETAEKIISSAFEGYDLLSNTRYDKVSMETLKVVSRNLDKVEKEV